MFRLRFREARRLEDDRLQGLGTFLKGRLGLQLQCHARSVQLQAPDPLSGIASGNERDWGGTRLIIRRGFQRASMTQDERTMLTDLANKVAQTPAPPRDPEAEEFIRTQIGKRPDALYLMAQTVLIQNLALEQAKRQIQELQARSGQSQSGSSGSFLGNRAEARAIRSRQAQTYSGEFRSAAARLRPGEQRAATGHRSPQLPSWRGADCRRRGCGSLGL